MHVVKVTMHCMEWGGDGGGDSLRSTIDFQLGGAASVGEYKKIISVSSTELIMQIGQRKEIQSWLSSERVAKG